MERKRFSITTRYIVIICLLILTVGVLLGAALLHQSKNALKTMISDHMTDIAKNASELIDGKELALLDDENIDPEVFDAVSQKIINTLAVFMSNHDVHYVYIVKKAASDNDDKYIFTVDADPDDPADYGEEVDAVTPGLIAAAGGTPSVDDEAAPDDWGCYYSSWYPIYDSDEKTPEHIVGVVGVDFDANHYDEQITRQMVTIGVIGGLSILAGGAIVLIITGRFRKKFRAVSNELSALSADVEGLTEEITSSPGFAERIRDSKHMSAEEDMNSNDDREVGRLKNSNDTGDTIEYLGGRIREVQQELHTYIDYVHALAYTDGMTGVGNKAAYLEKVQSLDKQIDEGTAAFSIAVFDINALKQTNDNYGHEQGDCILKDAATVIKRVFGVDSCYRIGGDEFIAVLDDVSREELASLFIDLDEEFNVFNRMEKQYDVLLSVSKGGASFVPGADMNYRVVFKRADEDMYKDKAAYYERTGERRI